MTGALLDAGLKNTVCIAVNDDGYFKLLPTSDGREPREYYRPHDVENDCRELVKEFGVDNVKIFREIEVVLQ